VLDVRDVQTTGSHRRRDEDRGLARLERVEGILPFPLRPVAVDRRRRVALPVQKLLERVCATLRLDKDERERLRRRGVEQVQQEITLVPFVDPDQLLRHVVRRLPYSPDRQENVVVQKVPGKPLNLLWERGRKHQRLPSVRAWRRHVVLLYNPTNLRLEPHVKHAVSLVKHQMGHALNANNPPLHQVNKSAWRRHQQHAAALDQPDLVPDRRAAVANANADHSSVGELPGFFKDLHRQLSGWGNHKPRRELLPSRPSAFRLRRRPVGHDGLDGWDKKGRCLAGAGLRARHDVSLCPHNRNRVLLHRGWLCVTAEMQVVADRNVEAAIFVRCDVFRNVVARGFHRNVVVLIKVDARHHLYTIGLITKDVIPQTIIHWQLSAPVV